MLEAPKNIPCLDEIGLLVLIIDPQNKTSDSNMTNNVAVLPVGLSCLSSESLLHSTFLFIYFFLIFSARSA